MEPASDGRRRNDAPISSPTVQGQLRTPHTPAPSEDRLFIDWSSIRSGSPPVISPPQGIPIGDILMTPRIERIPKTDQPAQQPSQPISEETHIGAGDNGVQGNFPTTSTTHQQPMERSNVIGERRMNDMGTNTSDVVIESTRNRTRTSNIEANTQTSIPIVDVLLPSGIQDHATIPHVNLSLSGYEPDSLRTSGMRSPSMRAQEVSTIPQLDGPRSIPVRDPAGGQMDRFSR